jgi:hypothetical protein
MIVAVALVAFVLVWPVGEYGILDDWAFVKSLQHMHYEGRLVVLDWNPMSLTGHLVWGLLFTKVLGFSFLATKISVFCAGVLVSLLVFWFTRRHGASPQFALIAGLGLLLNPLFMVHIFMYMTDVTGLLWQWLSIWCLALGIASTSRSRNWLLAASSICWGLAFLTRQHGVAVPLGLAFYVVIFDRKLIRFGFLIPSFLPGAWVAINGLAWHAAVQEANNSFQMSSKLVRNFVLDPPWANLPYIVFSYAVYIGLFAAPVALAVRWKDLLQLGRVQQIAIISVVWFGLAYWTHASIRGWYFPYCRNVITPSGFFDPFAFAVWASPQVWHRDWGIAVGLLGIVAFLICCASLGSWTSEPAASAVGTASPRTMAIRLVFLVFFFQLGYCYATAPILFDRHLLLLAPSAIVLAALTIRVDSTINWPRPALLMTGYALYSIAGSHDIHAVSRAVFFEGERLRSEGIPDEKIDAGYAFDGWYMYEKSFAISPADPVILPPWWPEPVKPYMPEVEHPWWIYELVKSVDPEYVVTAETQIPAFMFQGKFHYEERPGQQQYQTYWPWGRHSVKVFRCIRK